MGTEELLGGRSPRPKFSQTNNVRTSTNFSPPLSFIQVRSTHSSRLGFGRSFARRHERLPDNRDGGGPASLPPHEDLPPSAEPQEPLRAAFSGQQEQTRRRQPAHAGARRQHLHVRHTRPASFAQTAGPPRVPHSALRGHAVHDSEPKPAGSTLREQLGAGLPGEDGTPGQSIGPVRPLRAVDRTRVRRGPSQFRGGVRGAGSAPLQRDVPVHSHRDRGHGHELVRFDEF